MTVLPGTLEEQVEWHVTLRERRTAELFSIWGWVAVAMQHESAVQAIRSHPKTLKSCSLSFSENEACQLYRISQVRVQRLVRQDKLSQGVLDLTILVLFPPEEYGNCSVKTVAVSSYVNNFVAFAKHANFTK
jgi:hypothetical protein